jgi:hypothetical protein
MVELNEVVAVLLIDINLGVLIEDEENRKGIYADRIVGCYFYYCASYGHIDAGIIEGTEAGSQGKMCFEFSSAGFDSYDVYE